jgi:hypothetical protein
MGRCDIVKRSGVPSFSSEELFYIPEYLSDAEPTGLSFVVDKLCIPPEGDEEPSVLDKFGVESDVQGEHPADQGDIGHLCVVASTKGTYRPKSGLVQASEARISWMHYRGYRQSPFLPIPGFLKKVIAKWRQYAISPLRHVDPGKESIAACHVCRKSVEDPNAHRESKEHKRNCFRLDWSGFNAVQSELNFEDDG